jgi:hypothetical protein
MPVTVNLEGHIYTWCLSSVQVLPLPTSTQIAAASTSAPYVLSLHPQLWPPLPLQLLGQRGDVRPDPFLSGSLGGTVGRNLRWPGGSLRAAGVAARPLLLCLLGRRGRSIVAQMETGSTAGNAPRRGSPFVSTWGTPLLLLFLPYPSLFHSSHCSSFSCSKSGEGAATSQIWKVEAGHAHLRWWRGSWLSLLCGGPLVSAWEGGLEQIHGRQWRRP